MGVPRPYSVLLPMRFLFQAAHLVAVLTVLYDAVSPEAS